MRRLLLVTHVFPPLVAGGAPRMEQFARMLPDFGWDVTVLTARHSASAVDRESAAGVADRARVIAAWSPTTVVPRGVATPRRGLAASARKLARTAVSTVLFPDREILWAPSAIAAGRRALAQTRHDAVLASYGPASALVVGRSLARQFRLPFVVDFRDLWTTLPMSVFPTELHRRAAMQLERAVVRAASRVIAVSPGMAEGLGETHRRPGEIVSITNGFDPADVARVRDARGDEPRPFRMVYAGSVHAHYNLDPFWRCLRALLDAGHVSPATFRLDFVGNVALGDARAAGVGELVHAQPYVPHARVFDALAPADALLVLETPGYYARNGYAAKVFDYLLTGKPVLGLVERGGNTDRLLRAAGVAHTAEPHDEVALHSAFLAVLATKGLAPRPVDPAVAPFRDFDRRHLVETLAGVLDDVVTAEPHGRW